MNLAVQSYPELYTTLLGWQLYGDIWTLLTKTGIAFLPFIGIILQNIIQPHTSQQARDAGGTSLRRMEVDLLVMLVLIFFAVSPVVPLNTKMISYTPTCQEGGGNETVHAGATGTTYDQAFSIPQGDIRIPMFWYIVLSVSQGLTSASKTFIVCEPDLRGMVTRANVSKINDIGLKSEVQRFHEDCFLPAKTQYLSDSRQQNTDTLSPINSAIKANGKEDVDWIGSRGFSETYYKNLSASSPVSGFPYTASEDINADTNADDPPKYGTPDCATWWNAKSNGLRERLISETKGHYDDYANDHFKTDSVMDSRLKTVLLNENGYRAAGNGESASFFTKLFSSAGTYWESLSAYPLIYQAKEAAPIIRALLLYMMYAFLPIMLVFTRYKPSSFVLTAIVMFSLIYWSFIWEMVIWADNILMNALYGDNIFAKLSPNAALANMVAGFLFIVAPLFWFSFMGAIGIGAGGLVSVAFSSMSKPASAAAASGGAMAQSAIKTASSAVLK